MSLNFGKYKPLTKFGNPQCGFEKFNGGGAGEIYLAENEEENE